MTPFTPAGLFDLHARAHRSLDRLIDHVRSFASDTQLDQRFDGFGIPSLRRQIHHLIGAERYWIGVILDRAETPDGLGRTPPLDALVGLLEEVRGDTRGYLARTDPEELCAPRVMTVDPGLTETHVPAWIVARVVTHLFDHKGQMGVMCRMLGAPLPPGGFDFPLDLSAA